jgi:hypothetical protein
MVDLDEEVDNVKIELNHVHVMIEQDNYTAYDKAMVPMEHHLTPILDCLVVPLDNYNEDIFTNI